MKLPFACAFQQVTVAAAQCGGKAVATQAVSTFPGPCPRSKTRYHATPLFEKVSASDGGGTSFAPYTQHICKSPN
ncbi:hypothetical protein [Paucibacter sp. DJ1R-11]|uniref:hypothetical protein n=1 Tax=Paucibacter sp. DJ1R-11 TaxID=2893556 RepID=UPI0021E3F8F2|nr:hypothetical protein [Paucibacter sp. DJ1R-11]